MPPMPRILLRFLAVALALILPVQGMAAVSAGMCMALGHHEQGAGQETPGQAQDGAETHDGHAGHSHADDDGARPNDEGGKDSHCGPCTACCATTSIGGPSGLSISSSTTGAEYVFSQLPPPGIQPDRLDRPPLAL
jgi:hypothetical protein